MRKKDALMYLAAWRERYRDDLVEHILPFWLRHGLDHKHGGVYTCVDRFGQLMDSTKSVWFQGRFAYVCAFAYNNVERRPEWLDAARSALEFIEAHCFDADGRMYFEVKADGTPLRKRRYVFSESFAVVAMAEFALATGEQQYAQKALDLFHRMEHWLDTPGALEPKYLPALETQGHSITMIMLGTAAILRRALPHPSLDARIDRSIDSLRRHFMHPEFEALLETVGPEGEFIDTCMGRTINPGHCIETAWFLLEEARHRADAELRRMALTILDWSWRWGWDEEHGGIINFRDCRGLPPQDYSQDMKFWWPQTEAIIATLCAYRDTHEAKYLDWHRLVSEWTYDHFPDPVGGEWFGYLHRDGTVAQTAKGNLFKGPFHIPRMMVQGYRLCGQLLDQLGAAEE